MPLTTKVILTDGSGDGMVTVEPCFYAGSDAGTVNAEIGGAVGGATLTAGTMKVVAGDITVHGLPDTEYALYFDFSL